MGCSQNIALSRSSDRGSVATRFLFGTGDTRPSAPAIHTPLPGFAPGEYNDRNVEDTHVKFINYSHSKELYDNVF